MHDCPNCGGSDGNHFGDCIYDGAGGNSSLGGSLGGKLVFAGFCVVGVLLAVVFPPLGAGVILLGAYLTGV